MNKEQLDKKIKELERSNSFWKKLHFILAVFFVVYIILTISGTFFLETQTEMEKEYYKEQMMNFCEISEQSNQLLRFETNKTELNKLFQHLYEEMYPCEQWILEGEK